MPAAPASPAPAGRALFVYYRVEADRLAATVDAVRAMQQRLRRDHPGLRAELWRRPPVEGQPVTLMETYAAHGGVDDALAAAIEAAARALPPGRLGERHVEVFEPAR
jgi:hypothetical protein